MTTQFWPESMTKLAQKVWQN